MLAKIKTLPMIIRLAAAVLALVAFFLMFGDQLAQGDGTVAFNSALFGGEVKLFGVVIGTYKGATVGFVGYMLILIAGIASPVVALVLKDKKVETIVTIACAAVLIVASVLVFVIAAAFNGANDTDAFKLAACPIIAGILAIVAGLANGAVVALPYIKK